jgi:hypothetical protein
MDVLKEHAILVTGYYGDHIDRAHAKATELFDASGFTYCAPEGFSTVTPIMDGYVNSTRSFAILPDGSKEGWGTSDAGNEARTKMVEWLRAQTYEDGSNPLAWVEVQYGDETYHNSRALRSSDTDRKRYEKKA